MNWKRQYNILNKLMERSIAWFMQYFAVPLFYIAIILLVTGVILTILFSPQLNRKTMKVNYQYKIVLEQTQEQFERQVEHYLNKGWELYGEPQIAIESRNYKYLLQALTYEEILDEDED